MLLPGADVYCAGLLALRRFSQHFTAKYTVGEDKKSFTSKHRAPSWYTVHIMVNPALVIAFGSQKG